MAKRPECWEASMTTLKTYKDKNNLVWSQSYNEFDTLLWTFTSKDAKRQWDEALKLARVSRN